MERATPQTLALTHLGPRPETQPATHVKDPVNVPGVAQPSCRATRRGRHPPPAPRVWLRRRRGTSAHRRPALAAARPRSCCPAQRSTHQPARTLGCRTSAAPRCTCWRYCCSRVRARRLRRRPRARVASNTMLAGTTYRASDCICLDASLRPISIREGTSRPSGSSEPSSTPRPGWRRRERPAPWCAPRSSNV